MAEDERSPDPVAPPAEPRAEAREQVEPRQSFLRRHWGKLTLAALVVMPTLVFTIWAWITLSYSYASGERVGFVQKLSRKGWLCKTWEGELQMSNVPGSAPILFQFSVRSDSLARAIEAAAGNQVALRYDQHLGVPSKCFGETEYYVKAVRVVSRRP